VRPRKNAIRKRCRNVFTGEGSLPAQVWSPPGSLSSLVSPLAGRRKGVEAHGVRERKSDMFRKEGPHGRPTREGSTPRGAVPVEVP